MARELEPEVMDDLDESLAYEAMDHSAPNAAFVARLRELGASGRMLDLGTGPGHIPGLICERDASAFVVGIDRAQSMLRLAQRRAGARVALCRADGKRLPFPDASFDAVLSNTVLHHIPEPVAFLREVARVLRTGGALLVRDLRRPRTPADARELVRRHAAEETRVQRQLLLASLHAALTPDELRSAAARAGLEDSHVSLDSDRHMSLQRSSRQHRSSMLGVPTATSGARATED